MRPILSMLCLVLAMSAMPARAQVLTWTETTTGEWTEEPGGERLVGAAQAPALKGIASYGPFEVLDQDHAALVAETDSTSPADFAGMLRAFPGIRTIEMVDCPGTVDDVANLRLGRMIRARAIDTHVPAGGSVRSGAVELFLAGAHRSAEPSAEFAVHSWLDEDGRQPEDFAAADPVNRTYLAYYREMGLEPDQAAAFYALTNSVANDSALWLHTADIARYASLN